MNELLQPMAQIRANSIIIYNKYTGSRKKNVLKEASKRLMQSEKYTGRVTKGASKRMVKAISLLIESSEKKLILNPITGKRFNFKLSFITLTIPDLKHLEIKDAHKLLLEPLLKWLRQTQGLKNYVWKLEVQKRGVIHWHLTTDCFVLHSDLRNKWNKLLSRSNLNTSYVAEKGHNNANSTDIHSIKNIRNLHAYLVKYFTKSEQNETGLKGKIWDCSKNLKKANYYETELTEDIEADIYDYALKQKLEIVMGDAFTIIKAKEFKVVKLFPVEVREAYYQNLKNIREMPADLFECLVSKNKKVDNVVKSVQNKIVPKSEYFQTKMDFFALV